MSTKHIVSITLGDNSLQVECHYTPGYPAVMYRSNGDPGEPGEEDVVEIECICIGQEDVTDLMATLYVREHYNSVFYKPVWEKIEQMCLEKIWDEGLGEISKEEFED